MLNTSALLIPVFLLLILTEWYVSYKNGDQRYSTENTAMNFTIGAIEQIASLFSFILLFWVMQYVYDHYRLYETSNVWYQWVGGYIAVDFISYWYHRWSHRVNFLWAGHITHHSSELFNFSNGFRTSFLQGVNRIPFWALLPVAGFSPLSLLVILKVSGLFDFLQHTEYVPRLKWIEKIVVTPSAHRVHHGKNDIYIDKNYGSNFIIWDKLFGTYQEETEKVNFGITSEYKDSDPFNAISVHYVYLWNSMKEASRWCDKIKLWFMPPEWHPGKNTSRKNVAKNTTIPSTPQLKLYAYFQFILCVPGIIALLAYHEFMSIWEIIICALIGITSMAKLTMIFNNSTKHDFKKKEFFRITLALAVVLLCFFIDPHMYQWAIIAYLMASMLSLVKIQTQQQLSLH